MKKLFSLIFVLALSAMFAGCSNVEAGYAGVEVSKYGDERGVKNNVLGPGRYWSGWNTKIYTFPTFSQSDTYAENQAVNFQSKDGTSIAADFGVTFAIKRENVATVFEKYRRGVDEISDIYLRNMVRDALNDAASARTDNQLMDQKGLFMAEVNKDVIARAAASGITVEGVSNIGEFRWPAQIKLAMTAKQSAVQDATRVENELRKTIAEGKKSVAKAEAEVGVAKADALAIALRGEALSRNPSVLQQKAIEKWNGVLPTVTGAATPFVNLK